MRATTIHGVGDIRFTQVPDPALTKPTDAIVKVVGSCICGSDLWNYRGSNGDIEEPRTIGHECIGVIEEVGADVRDFKAGDFVIVPFDHCDNTCPHCLAGVQSVCENLGFTVSGQSEYALVNQADGSLVKLDETPDPTMYPDLLALTDVMATGWHAAVMSGLGNGAKGGTAVVVGDGAVGLCGVLAAAQLGAERVVAMSRHEARQEIAKKFGATDIVAARGKEGEAAVRELTGGVGADYVLECVGTDQSFKTASKVARPGATVGFVGVPHDVNLPVNALFRTNVGLKGGMAPVRRYLPDLLRLTLEGTINPGLVFDKALPFAEAAEGYRLMDERLATKVQLTY
ncbi:zinc-dependent alcohol dehydrogenase family protein [Nocardioides sp. NPDC006303]|jgi:threonine dehydrogenase-like Zn-dependent dehydrogenase|uniref:zinc-dependent alcohol dehydrogenase family protein n=1 Tax=Nocardioides sp. NPDC006303 TaxID=3156747 RepID=UPI002FC23AD4